MDLRVKKIILLLSLFVSIKGMAQIPVDYEHSAGAWYMLFTQSRVSDRLSIHAEAQHRLFLPFDQRNQLLLRTALNYHAQPDLMLSGGYGFIQGWRYETDELSVYPANEYRFYTYENRIYQQAVLKNKIGKNKGIVVSHRYRLEQRWVTANNATNFSGRARYFLQVDVPILTITKSPSTSGLTTGNTSQLYYSFYDEVFLNINASPFSQNRFFHALAYKFNPEVTVKAGYLYNFIGSNPGFNYHRFQFGVWLKPDFRKKG